MFEWKVQNKLYEKKTKKVLAKCMGIGYTKRAVT